MDQLHGGVDMSDVLPKCCNEAQKTPKSYKKLFYHFVDIAVVNSFTLHKEMALEKRRKPPTQWLYGEVLYMQLADCGVEEVGVCILFYYLLMIMNLPVVINKVFIFMFIHLSVYPSV